MTRSDPQRPLRPSTALLPFALLLVLAARDLHSPPISPTIHRQTQTYVQMRQLADRGPSWDAFSIGVDGPTPFRAIFEFPIYHVLAAGLMRLISVSWFWPKLISLLAALITLASLRCWLAQHWGRDVAALAVTLLATIPVFLLLATAVQPDSLALAASAGLLLVMERWRSAPSAPRWAAVLALALTALLVKFTVVVPFVPALVWLYLRRSSSFRRPAPAELASTVAFVVLPFLWWLRLRAAHTDPAFLQLDRALFLGGDLGRFLSPRFYVKPFFIVGAMVCAGVGLPLVVVGLRKLGALGWALVAGIPLHYLLIATVADQVYYALPLAPTFALLIARGWLLIEGRLTAQAWALRVAAGALWCVGLLVAVPYTLRHDDVTWQAAKALEAASARSDLVLVLNAHDRGVGIGGYNPSLLVLADRVGWTISPARAAAHEVTAAVERRRGEGARWLVATWYSPALEPWVNSFLPATFSRQPRLQGVPVAGEQLISALTERFRIAARGPNFIVLDLGVPPGAGR
jgi:hypothetical protein